MANTIPQTEGLRRLISQHERSLQSLEEQAGTFGFHTPPHITTRWASHSGKTTEKP